MTAPFGLYLVAFAFAWLALMCLLQVRHAMHSGVAEIRWFSTRISEHERARDPAWFWAILITNVVGACAGVIVVAGMLMGNL